MVEFPDPEERKRKLHDLIGIEDKAWLQVDAQERVWAVADEDLDRENDEKTSSVHFLRFELTKSMAEAFKGGAQLSIGIDHPRYSVSVEARPAVRDSLARDLA
jgi:hypothetical protein